MDHNIFIASLTIWRESRGEPIEGLRAVAHVINNRATKLAMANSMKQLPEDYYYKICVAPWQFSSMTAHNDPQLGLYPSELDPVFVQITNIVEAVASGSDEDNTFGADHYFNPGIVMPEWSKHMTKTASIGHHDFYK